MLRMRVLIGAALVGVLGACVPRSAPPPAQPAPPPPVVQPPRPLPPPPPAMPWDEAPLTPGDWTYGMVGAAATASYGTGGAPALTVRCVAPGQIAVGRSGAPGADRLTVRTSFGDRNLPAAQGAAMLRAGDPLFDQIAFSRGRFAVEAPGAAMMIAPTWPELAWVVERCRG